MPGMQLYSTRMQGITQHTFFMFTHAESGLTLSPNMELKASLCQCNNRVKKSESGSEQAETVHASSIVRGETAP